MVFFFETSTSKLRSQLAGYLRHYYDGRMEEIWNIPILLIGLRKDKYTPTEFAQERNKRLQEMQGIIKPVNILFFGKNCEESDFEREVDYVNRFVRKAISRSLDS